MVKDMNDSERRPGGRGRRKGELRNKAVLDPNSQMAPHRLKVLRDPLWEIQPAETTRAYEAFKVYRDLGASRLQKRVCEILERSDTQVGDLSSKYRWVERVRAYDAWIDTHILAAREEQARSDARSWLARQEQIREQEFTLSMGLAEKIREMLKHPVTKVSRRKESKDGKTIYITIVEPARWDWKAAADILARIGYQARLAAEMVTDGARAPTPDATERGLSDVDAWLQSIGVPASSRGDDPADGTDT